MEQGTRGMWLLAYCAMLEAKGLDHTLHAIGKPVLLAADFLAAFNLRTLFTIKHKDGKEWDLIELHVRRAEGDG